MSPSNITGIIGVGLTILMLAFFAGLVWFFFTRHRHEFQETQRMLYGPAKNFEVSGTSPQQINQLIYGKTVVTQRCECGKFRQYTLEGRVSLHDA